MSLTIRALLGRRATRRLPWIAAMFLLLLGTGTAAYAFWASSTSSNNAAAAADTLSPGSSPAVTANGAALTVTWAGGTTVNGRPATGYTVTRYSAATGGTATPATGGCAGTVTTLSCTEQNVQGGMWYYTVTPAIALWTGAESPRSTGVKNDSSAPTATVSAISPTPNTAKWNNTSPVTVTITADDGSAGSGVASITYTIDGVGGQTVSGAVATVPVSGDGTHTVSYFATDKVGNAGGAQSQTVRIDTQAPAAPLFTTVPPYVYSGNVNAVPLKGTAEADAKITLTASDAGAAHSTPPVTATADGNGTWTASMDLSSLDQGTVTYSAVAADIAGNVSAAKTATSIKDTQAPALTIDPLAYIYSGNVGTYKVSGATDSGTPISVSVSDSATSVPATASGSSWTTAALNLSGLKETATTAPVVTVTVTATTSDVAGNRTTVTATGIKDTVAPVVTITAPMYASKSSNVGGTTETGRVVTVTVRDSEFKSVTTQVTPTGTSWSAPVDISSLKDGTLTYTAANTDVAGNSSTATAAGTNSKDTVEPTATVTLTNGGTAGKADQGDSLTIQFSKPMDSSKICATWNNASAQTLDGNKNVTVNISASNVLTVSSTTCTSLNLGSIALGSHAAYGSAGALSFNGNGANTSSVSWNGTTTLTIKLGKADTGSSGTTTTADTPTYTAGTGPTDLAGNLVGPNPSGGTTTYRF